MTGDADTGVADADYRVCTFQLDREPNPTAAVGKFAGVVQDIADDLCQPDRIAVEVHGVRRQRDSQLVLEAIAERAAGLDKQKGGLWHPYRRRWATLRKHLPAADVAAVGGWRSTDTLKLYQQADDQTILRVVLGGAERRQAK